MRYRDINENKNRSIDIESRNENKNRSNDTENRSNIEGRNENRSTRLKENVYEYWLAATGISDRKKTLLRAYMKSAREVYYIEEMHLHRFRFLNEKDCNTMIQAKKTWDLQGEYEKMQEKGIRLITCFEPEYPKKLVDIPDKPYALYVKGRLPDEESLSVAVVGARRCSHYGEKYAYEFGEVLSEYGIQIVSGLAFGIDGISQRGALTGKGKTFAVLGNGVDICYPRDHAGLYQDILEQGGGILSELPPGVKPLPYHFPRRNRIISGLSDLVLVIEAKEKSGSLITADMALEQGKDVYAMPGPVDSALSRGCHQLIRQGAGILMSPEMLLEELGISDVILQEKNKDVKKVLESTENLVYSSVVLSPRSVGEIIETTGLMPRKVLETLSSLEIRGYIKEVSKNYYVRI